MMKMFFLERKLKPKFTCLCLCLCELSGLSTTIMWKQNYDVFSHIHTNARVCTYTERRIK